MAEASGPLNDRSTAGSEALPAQRDPIEIIREFEADKDPRVRRNAATALSAIADLHPGAIEDLLEMLLWEGDAEGRIHIEAQIESIPAAVVATVADHVADRLNDGASPQTWTRFGRLLLKGLGRGREDFPLLLLQLAVKATDTETSDGAIEMLLALKEPSASTVERFGKILKAAAVGSAEYKTLVRLRIRGFARTDRSTVAAVVQSALQGGDPELERAAFDALVRMTGDEARAAADVLETVLFGPDNSGSQRVYRLLGELRLAHALLGNPAFLHAKQHWLPSEGRLWSRLRHFLGHARERFRNAASLASESAVVERRRTSMGFIWMIAGWTIAGVALMAVYLAAVVLPQPDDSFYPALTFSTVAVAVTLGVFATRRATPIYRHYSRLPAGLLEGLAVALWVFGPAVVALFLPLALFGFSGGLLGWAVALLVVPTAICAFVIAIRFGTTLAFGAVRGPAYRKNTGNELAAWQVEWARRNHLTQVAVGASTGFLVAWGLMAIGRWWWGNSDHLEVARVSEAVFMFVAPTAAGVAAAFATIDKPSPGLLTSSGSERLFPAAPCTPANEKGGRSLRFRQGLCAAMLLPLLVAVLLTVDAALDRYRSSSLVVALAGRELLVSQPVRSVPFRTTFAVAFPQRVRALVPQQQEPFPPDDAPDFRLALFEWPAAARVGGALSCENTQEAREVHLVDSDDPPTFDLFLGVGCYAAEVQAPWHEEERWGTAVGRVIAARAQSSGASAGDGYTLDVTLNVGRRTGTMQAANGSPVGDGAWTLDVPSEVQLSVPVRSAVWLSLSSITRRAISETAPRDRTTQGLRAAMLPALVEVDGGVDSSVRSTSDETGTRFELPAGTYTVRVVPNTASNVEPQKAVLNVLRASLPEPVVEAGRQLPPVPEAPPGTSLSGSWPVGDTLPATFEFVVRFPQRVAIRRQPLTVRDPFGFAERPLNWTIELRRVSAEPSSREIDRSDPTAIIASREDIVTPLEPGRYQVVVLTPRQRLLRTSTDTYQVPAGVTPAPAIELTLNMDAVGTSPRHVK